MPKLSGSFSGRANWQTTVPQNDIPGHELSIVEISGLQRSTDAQWADARVTYWGLGELISGNGTQRGYFIDEHTDGATDRGTFEAQIATSGGETVLEGTFTFTGGTGKFNGLTGGGTFRSRMTSPVELETTWDGAYELAEARRGAGR